MFGFGCYQAYITFAAMLVIVYSLDRLLHTETPLRTLIGKWLRALACAGTGYVLYAVMNRILLSVQHVKLTDYQGVSAIGGFGTSAGSGFAPLSAAKQCLIDFVYFFTGSLRHMNFYSVLNLCMLALLFAGLSARIARRKLFPAASTSMLYHTVWAAHTVCLLRDLLFNAGRILPHADAGGAVFRVCVAAHTV